MAFLSKEQFTGTGSQVQYPVNFPYLSRDHVKLYVDNVETAFTWVNDNLIDVMSANDPDEGMFGRIDEPFGTHAWNRYRAGWIDPNDVIVYTGGVETVTLAPAGSPGTQMIAFPTDDEYTFYFLDARRSLGAEEVLPVTHEGVTSHYVSQPCGDPFIFCHGLGSDIYTYPPAPYTLEHVTQPGGSKTIDDTYYAGVPVANGTKVKVLSGSDAGYVLQLIGFDDIQTAAFHNPGLTTVRQTLVEMGVLAASKLLEQLAEGSMAAEVVTVEPELVIRESTAPRAGSE